MIPELRQLRYFVAVAEELHFSRAARRLNMAQPPLSHQIRQLELSLGVQLLVRSSRSVELTPAGSVFLEGARRALAEAERAAAAAQRASHGQVSSLCVGFTDSAALSVLPGAVRRFTTAHSSLRLELRDDSSLGQIDAVRRDLVDVALVRGPVAGQTGPGVLSEVLLREPFCVALVADHRLAASPRVSLRELAEEPMILFPRHLAPSFHDVITGMCHDAGYGPTISYEAAEYQTILSLVAAGLGVTIVPVSVRSLGRAGVVFRGLTEARGHAELAAVYRPHRESAALHAFLMAARAEAEQLEREAAD